jgi:hypothetical protein
MKNQPGVRKIHLIFKTHLDVGYTDFARDVVRRYFIQYIPRALDVAEEMRERGGVERFVWTTGSWLIYEYLEQASPAERERMERAIHRGEIAWHGLPCTTHSELLDPGLFRYGLSLSRELDGRYARLTVAAKMTDVPGHTRGIVPLLAEAGVRFLHIGVNPASTPPDVPPVFRWKDPSGDEVTVMYQKGSYGELMLVPGMDEAIAFAHTGDNLGPQNVEGVLGAFRALRERFPGAEVVASTLDDFALALEDARDSLPVISGEIGDTWIHGAATDPKKIARYRELLRLRRQWLETAQADPENRRFKAFSRFLLMVPEHTWGLDEKTYLADYENYAGEAFRSARARPNFQKFESSWDEQREYVDQAVGVLDTSGAGLKEAAQRALQAIEPRKPDLTGWRPIPTDDPLPLFETAQFRLAFDERGAITLLEDKAEGWNWAGAENPLGLFVYQTFSQADYDRFYRQYIINKGQVAVWAVDDFTKPGIERAHAIAGEWTPVLERLYQRRVDGEEQFLLQLALPRETTQWFGGAEALFLRVSLPEDEPALTLDLQWFDKPACRLPEASWFSFVPNVPDPQSWKMEKMGEWISPLEVVRGGNRHLHAVGHGVSCQGLSIASLDAPLVAPGKRSLLDFNNYQPNLRQGMHFLLHDNLWGTNFPMWYEDDSRFRFKIVVGV